jgi:hypothetical protein
MWKGPGNGAFLVVAYQSRRWQARSAAH